MSRAALALAVALAVALAGCAGVASSPEATEAASASKVGRCDFGDQRLRVRDLTQAWASRTYLLPDGSVCRPGGGA